MTELKQADEPVAWMWQHDETGRTGFVDPWQVENGWQANNPRCKLVYPLYTTPPAAQPAPCNLAADGVCEALECCKNLPPAQRQWVDLTDEDIDDIYQGAGKNDLLRAREVLAKFKEKNA